MEFQGSLQLPLLCPTPLLLLYLNAGVHARACRCTGKGKDHKDSALLKMKKCWSAEISLLRPPTTILRKQTNGVEEGLNGARGNKPTLCQDAEEDLLFAIIL